MNQPTLAPHAADDSLLVQQYLKGSHRAFEQLLRRHRAKMVSTILHIVKDRDVADDLYQEACIKIVNVLNKGGYDEKGKFLPWALRVARNQAIDYFRRQRRNPTVNASDNAAFMDNFYATEDHRERQMIRQENKAFVRELIRELPKAQREVLIMRTYGGLSFKEIARLTDVSINTALGRMRYALNNLRKLADERGYSL